MFLFLNLIRNSYATLKLKDILLNLFLAILLSNFDQDEEKEPCDTKRLEGKDSTLLKSNEVVAKKG